MTDIRTQMIPSSDVGQMPYFDWKIASPGLAEDDGLETAIILSLFTDRLAETDDIIPDGTTNRRGWWGDAYADISDDLIGSRLWLLHREKDMRKVVNKAQEYAAESLQWLVDDEVVKSVSVVAGWVDRHTRQLTTVKSTSSMPGVLAFNVEITRAFAPLTQYQFKSFWKNL